MSASATLKHEDTFERDILGLIGGGFAAGIVASLLELVVGREVQALTALSFAAVVGLVINGLDPREDTAMMRLILALAGGVMMGGLAGVGVWGAPMWAAAIGGGFLGAALTFDRAQSLGRKLWTWGIFAAALPAGVFTAETLFATGFMQPLDVMLVREALAGGAWGLFLAVAAGMSDLEWEHNSVISDLDEAIARHRDPVRDYLESAKELYRQITRECERAEQDDTRRRAVEIATDTVGSLLRFASRFEELRDTLRRSGGERLSRRLERMERRLDDVKDASLRRELEQSRAHILQQVQMRQRLELACARLESRLQRSVTTLEKLHLTLVQHATSATNDAGLTEALSRLEQLADEVELKSLSVDELCEMEALEASEANAAPAEQDQQEQSQQGQGADGELDVSPEGADGDLSTEPTNDPDSPGASDHRDESKYEHVVCEQDSSC
ncbi:sulfite exporter TauE/SafE family protein [Persicimonas caeni]|uniref:Sulfite exporter TauE/SafE family protein n=1 Tax=Persicimonas caeni TaxID=2292766 RepID=A0A4Y6Q1H0_PERCE|nr:sulfite exporter TauE/SafE family protein [Persicimonas caeni]QDG54434.1 sulfite exporter TauE/SafE family protein [Persicimonas caeni]QED35655.1 sulfite exporter TauE/SafE family protein [Persicimonas caeni]